MRRAAPTDFDLQGAPGGHGTLSDTFLRRILDAEGNKSTGDGQHRTYNDDFQGSRDSRGDVHGDGGGDVLCGGIGRPATRRAPTDSR